MYKETVAALLHVVLHSAASPVLQGGGEAVVLHVAAVLVHGGAGGAKHEEAAHAEPAKREWSVI